MKSVCISFPYFRCSFVVKPVKSSRGGEQTGSVWFLKFGNVAKTWQKRNGTSAQMMLGSPCYIYLHRNKQGSHMCDQIGQKSCALGQIFIVENGQI